MNGKRLPEDSGNAAGYGPDYAGPKHKGARE